MINFEFATASQILFGEGKAGNLGEIAAKVGSRILIVAGHRGRSLQIIQEDILSKKLAVEVFNIRNEPDLNTIQQGVDVAKSHKCDVIIAVGGGSAVDAGKAIAAMMTNPGDLVDYLEVIGKNKAINNQPTYLIAVPTTAGTGSEVTRNAVISVPDLNIKVSLRSSLMFPRVAVVDPQLTYALPPALTASTGMDALTQVIEPFVSRRSNGFTDVLCKEGIRRISTSLVQAYSNGDDHVARHNMAFGSLLGGIVLANAGLGAVHGFAGPIGGVLKAPHGLICAALLVPVIKANIHAMKARSPEHPALARYNEIASLVTGKSRAGSKSLVSWLDDLRLTLNIPGLRKIGLTEELIDPLVRVSMGTSSMKANPIELTYDELSWALNQAM